MIRKHWALWLMAVILGFIIQVSPEKNFSWKEVSLISSAQAVVGRPLTPMSVAGVARRTARRCAAGVYYC